MYIYRVIENKGDSTAAIHVNLSMREAKKITEKHENITNVMIESIKEELNRASKK